MSLWTKIQEVDTRLVPFFIILVAILMVIGGYLGMEQSVIQPVKDAWITRDWVATPAILDEVGLQAADGTLIPVPGGPGVPAEDRQALLPTGIVKLKVSYHYYVDDETYTAKRYGVHKGLDDGDTQRYAAARMYRKQEVTAWVNPRNPNEAVLTRELHWGVMAIGIPSAAIAFVGLLILWYGAKTGWQLRQIAKRMRELGRS